MKKLYINPKVLVADLELESVLLQDSQHPELETKKPGDGEYEGLVKEQRGGSLWGNEW